jgi:peptide subunit release factor 1 (eRF1)
MTTSVPDQVGEGEEHVLAVVLDRARARFFEVTAAGAQELSSLHSPAMRGGRFHSDRQGGPGWGEHDYHDRIREEERRHYAAIAKQLERLERLRPSAGYVLAGPGGVGDTLRRSLPAPLADRVIGTVKLNPTEVTASGVHAATVPLQQRHQQDEERKLVAAMLEGLGTGRAENGARAVLRALAKGQVRTLLVRRGVSGAGFRCAASGRLVIAEADCRGQGRAVAVNDLIPEAMADARRQGAAVTVIRDSEAAKAIDSLAALLRFA